MSDNLAASIIAGKSAGRSGVLIGEYGRGGLKSNRTSIGVLDKKTNRTYYADRGRVFVHSEDNIAEHVQRFRRIYRNSLMSQVEERVKANGKPGPASDPFGAVTRQKAMAQAVSSAEPVVGAAYRAYADHLAALGKDKTIGKLPEKTPLEAFGHRLMIAAGTESRRLRKLYEKYGAAGEVINDDEPEKPAPPPVMADSISGVDVATGRLKAAVALAPVSFLHVPQIECLAALMGLDPADVHQAMSLLGREGYRASSAVSGWHITPPEPPKSKVQVAAEKVLDLDEDASLETRVALMRDLFNSLVESTL